MNSTQPGHAAKHENYERLSLYVLPKSTITIEVFFNGNYLEEPQGIIFKRKNNLIKYFEFKKKQKSQ